MQIGIYIYDGVEVLDFAGPFEVFSTAARLSEGAFKLCLIAEHAAPVIARGGFSVNPHNCIADHPVLDVLVVPGGVHTNEIRKPAVVKWIADVSPLALRTVSVCTGVFLLAAAEVIDTHQVTTHWEDIADLRQQFPKLDVVDDQRWVEDGQIVSSAGISAGLDMSLYLVSSFYGRDLALRTARQMDYLWRG